MSNIELTFDDIESGLDFIGAVDDYKLWDKIGRSLYSEYGEQIRDIFEFWSSRSGNYKEKKFNDGWKSFKDTHSFNIGSFIFEAKKAGWKPSRKELTDEERKQRQIEYAKHRAEQEQKQKLIDKDRINSLKKELSTFLSWPSKFTPTAYMQEKCMIDLPNYADVRLGTDQYDYPFLAWSYYDDLFNEGNFCGYEKIYKRRYKDGNKQPNKFSCKNANTKDGFITFGTEWVHGRKRVFVVGGLADAYAAHITSGEIVISTVGEGRIPSIIKRLQEKHADIEFIAAPDNDGAGFKTVNDTNGFWTLPQTEGRDWSDVYIQEGNAAAKAQLLNVRGFKTITSNSRYLQAEIKQGLNLLKSGMGTGKSTTVQQFIRQNPNLKTLIVSHRRALAKSLRNSINDENITVDYYEDLTIQNPGNDIDANAALRAANILVCSVDSLHKLATSRWDAVFIDEIEQNLGHYYADTNKKGEDCLNFITFALTHSDYQIMADAHLGNLTKSFCNRIGLNCGTIYDNQYKTGIDADGNPKKLFVYESKAHLTEEIMQQLMASGKRYIYANSKAEVKRIASALEQERERKNFAGKTLVVHSDSVNEDKSVAAALQDINAVVPDLDVIIASPTLGTGFDISSDCHQFDKTIGFLSSRVGTSEEGHQGLNRARNINEFHVYLDPTERSEPVESDYIHNKLISEVSAETMKILSIDATTGEYASRNPLFEWLFCEVKAQHNHSKNNYKMRFLDLAAEDGYEIIQIAKNEAAAEFGKIIRTDANERNNREMLRNITEAPVHVGEAFNNMMSNGEDHSPVEIEKSKVVHDLNLIDATNEELDTLFPMAKAIYDEFTQPGENVAINNIDAAIEFPTNLKEAVTSALTFSQAKNRYVNGIKRLAWVNVNEQTAKALDTKDIQHSGSRVSWRHISIRRMHMIKLLRIAGIDDQLNYNGRKWTSAQLNAELGPWLRQKKNQERLYKYSNITVTANTIENPSKWLNNHLRSFGVPIISGKTRTKGKAVNCYGIDTDAWEGVKSLVAMRTRGIESSVQNDDFIDIELLQRSVYKFIDVINEGVFKSGFNIQYKKLDEQCALTGQLELRDLLAQTYAQIEQQSDPLRPAVLYKSIGQSGSPIAYGEASHSAVLLHSERKGEDPQFAHSLEINKELELNKNGIITFKMDSVVTGPHIEYDKAREAHVLVTIKDPLHAYLQTGIHHLDDDDKTIVHDVIKLAVDELQLRRFDVINHLVEFEVDSALVDGFKHDKAKWANHIKQALDMEAICASNRGSI